MKLSMIIKNLMGTPLAKAATGTAGLKVAFLAFQFFISVVLARLLGMEGYGVYIYSIAWLNLLTVFALFGIDKLIVREISVYAKRAEWSELRGILNWSVVVVMCVSTVLGAVVAMVAWFFSSDGSHALSVAVSIAMLALPLATLSRLRQAAMQGLNQIVIGQLPENLIQPVVFLCLVTVLWMQYGGLPDAVSVIGLYIVALSVAFLIGAVQFAKRMPNSVRKVKPAYFRGEWLRSAMPMLLVGGINIMNARIDTILLGVIKGAEAAGIYVVAARGAELIVFVMVVVNMAVAPTFAGLYASNELERLQKVVSNSARIMLIGAIPVAAGMILFGSWYLWLFGPEFMVGQKALTILSIGHLVNVSMGLVGLLLIMTGHERQAALGVGVSLALNLVLNLILIPIWGVVGAATATAISIAVSNLLLAILVYTRTGINPTAVSSLFRKIE